MTQLPRHDAKSDSHTVQVNNGFNWEWLPAIISSAGGSELAVSHSVEMGATMETAVVANQQL
jgi:hypothetical protein